MVINGAGAAAVSIARLFLKLGLNCENLVLCDSKGVVSTRREDLNPVKEQLATDGKTSIRWPTPSKVPTSSSAFQPQVS